MAPVALFVAAAAALALSIAWGLSAYRLAKLARRTRSAFAAHPTGGVESDDRALSRSTYVAHAHGALVWAVVALVCASGAASHVHVVWPYAVGAIGLALVAGTVAVLLITHSGGDARAFNERATVLRTARDLVDTEGKATQRWADRLVPEHLPEVDGLDLARAAHAATGMMTGDFLDLVEMGGGRIGVVIGDAAGHGVDASITAFQAKYVLRSYMRRFLDPAQVLEELNKQLSELAPDEDMLSLFVAVVDLESETFRYASAGHCRCWGWRLGEPVPLDSTGPLLMMSPTARYRSKEIPFERGDQVLLYTDGIIEARRNQQLYGTDRVVGVLRKDASSSIDVLCKALMSSALDHAQGEIADDCTVFGIRRV